MDPKLCRVKEPKEKNAQVPFDRQCYIIDSALTCLGTYMNHEIRRGYASGLCFSLIQGSLLNMRYLGLSRQILG